MSTDTPPVVRERAYTWEDPRALAGNMAGRTGLEFLQALVSGELPPRRSWRRSEPGWSRSRPGGWCSR